MVTRKEKTSKLTLSVTPTGMSGVSKNRIFNYVNPSLTDDKALGTGNALAALSSDTLNYVQRTDTAKLIAE